MLLAGMLAAALLCCGCASFIPQTAPAPVLEPEEAEEPEETPVPEEENPLKVFLDGFYAVYQPYGETLEALSKNDSAAVDEALAAEQHIQRLQQLFSAQASLLQDPNDKRTWNGMLFGGMEGTGSVEKTLDGCTFTCAITKWGIARGSIRGSLKGNALTAKWEQEGIVRSGAILQTETGYNAWVDWDGESVMLLMEDGILSYGNGAQATASSLSQEQWARWYLKDGKLFQAEPAATASSLQEGTE